MKSFLIYIFFALAVSACKIQGATTRTKAMNTQNIKKFHIIGIAIRTTNENGQAPKDIEALWEKFWSEKIQDRIPNRVSKDIYAVYTDYETDFKGKYATIIGLPVYSLENIPQGFVGITIEKAAYQKFISKGKMPEAVVHTWMEIWGNADLNRVRSYTADFTIHGEKYYDGAKAEVVTYIGVNE